MGYELIPAVWNFFVVLNWTFWIGLVVFIATRKKWSWVVRGSILGAIAVFFIFWVFIPLHEEKVLKDEKRVYRQAAYDYFHKKCAEDSGRFVYKPVLEPQDSVYMMKPRKNPTPEELHDQFWMGDPYTGTLTESGMLNVLLKGYGDRKNNPKYLGFTFVESSNFENNKQLWRYSLRPTGKMIQENRPAADLRPEMELNREPIDIIHSRYGYTWDDLSTQEDRQYWVAKSRLQIVDLITQEIIAERIGYVIEEGFGSTANFRNPPWIATGGGDTRWKTNYCPPRNDFTDQRWIFSVLHNVPFW